MKVLIINSVCGIGSTGRICADLTKAFLKEGHDVRIAYGRDTVSSQFSAYSVRIGTKIDVLSHGVISRVFDKHGLGSIRATKCFLKWADEYNPDLLWLHNIHGYYINYELLFGWIKTRPNMKVKWTLHDCWAFTGHCSHFSLVKCEKWKEECIHCVQKNRYPKSLWLDNSNSNFERKRNAFTGIENMVLITPSKWLADLVKQSFLKEYTVKVHYNTIDTTIFKPTPSDFRSRYGLIDKRIILGVANSWNDRKGLNDFYKLASMLDDRFVIILVGLSKKQIKGVPKRIIGIQRTKSVKELAEIYTAADLFINPTYEDTYPTVNLEAEACGTRVVTYDVGGCKEGIKRIDSTVVEIGNVERLYRECDK